MSFDHVMFKKDTLKQSYFITVETYNSGDTLWNNIQRDILVNLSKNHFTVFHLYNDSGISNISQLDDKIGELYPFFESKTDEYFIEVMPNDSRFLTKVMNDSLIFQCGNLFHIAIFKEKPNLYDYSITMKNAEFVIHSFYDNLGFYIDIQNTNQDDIFVETTVKSVLNSYHIAINNESLEP